MLTTRRGGMNTDINLKSLSGLLKNATFRHKKNTKFGGFINISNRNLSRKFKINILKD